MPRRIVYDNTKLAVARILGDGTRQRTQVFSELQSHYLFDDRFGRPGKGNDKGKVEGLVGYARRNFFVPIPRFDSWDALNADLACQCRARRGRRLRRHTETIGERFTTAAALVNELLEARDDKRLLRVQKQLAKQDLLIVDELGYVPLSKTGAELLFEIFSQRYEQASTLVTSNLPFNEWTEIFGSERLTGALLDRLTHHVHILELNGESYRLEHSKKSPPARGRSGILKLPPATPLSGTPTHCQMV